MSDPIVAGDFGFSAAQLDALLAEAGIDLLLASSKHNIRYLLDGHHHHFFAHMDAIGISRYLPILVYPSRRPGDAAYVANRNEKDAIAVRAAEGRPLWAGTVLAAASGSAEAMGVAIGHLRRVGVSPRTIGVEMGFLPADAYLALRDAFPDAKIVDAHRPLERLRSVKTPAELARLRDASDRVVDAMLAVIGSHGPGTTKRELEAALRREESQRGLVFEYALITVGSSHGRAPSNEVWQAGDILSLDSGGNLDGYIGDLCRMAILGEPDAELEDLLGLVERVQMAARTPMRPGVPGVAIYEAVREAMTALPASASFVAHGMGLIGHEAPRLTAKGPIPYPDSDAALPLQAGMVVSIETTLPHPKRGFIKLEDTVAVTDTGWEAFGDRGRGWNRGAA
jgi:Xaa-Pro aminopeptidase